MGVICNQKSVSHNSNHRGFYRVDVEKQWSIESRTRRYSELVVSIGDPSEIGMADQENAEEIITRVWHYVPGWVFCMMCERDSTDENFKSGAILEICLSNE